jgi:protein SCO1/2
MTRSPATSAASLLLALAALAGAACGGGGTDDAASDGDGGPAGIARDPAPEVGEVALPDAAGGGAPFALRADDGGLLLVFFGYTSCPDVCPTTMADVRAALGDLPGADAERIGLAMVTVDPGRDTGPVLTDYVRSFVPGAHALRTEDDAQLRAAADAFGVTYQVEATAAGEVEVGHTGHLYAVDDQGLLRLQWPFGTPVEGITADLAQLLEDPAAVTAAAGADS